VATRSRSAAKRHSIRWLFIGGGINYQGLEQAVVARDLRSVVFKDYQDRALLCESLNTVDAHLVTLRPELEGLIVPSKVYGCMAAGRPVIFIGAADGEVGTLLRKHHCGIVIGPDDATGLADCIEALAHDPGWASELGLRARQAFERHFDVRHAQERWRTLVEGLGANVTLETVAAPEYEVRIEAGRALATTRVETHANRNRTLR
jgi:glycosyltransferase involved in cell wall biosynthesis